jgi:basic membrane protein A and related proteins
VRTLKWKLGVALVLVAALAASVVAAGSARPKADYRVALVTDIGSLQDHGFNELANKGRLALGTGFETRLYETKVAADRLPNLLAAAQAGYDLVIGTGFLMFDSLDKLTPRFPNTKFAGIDVTTFLMSKPYTNYYGIQFAEHEAGYLVGYIAGLEVARERKGNTIGAVGANNVPPILKFMSGYIQGAKRANPKVKVLINFANDPTFSDQAKCKEQALNQIEKGARIVFQVAGLCGVGVINAAKEKKVWAIGVDADQAFLAPQTVLTSALKGVDKSVINMAKLLKAYPDRKGGKDVVYTVKSGSVGYAPINKAAKLTAKDKAKIAAVLAKMKKGQIKVVDILPQFK